MSDDKEKDKERSDSGKSQGEAADIIKCMKMFQETLAAVKIPLGNGKYFQLGCDVDLYERWGVKCK